MSYCSPCSKLKQISLCTDSLVIGKAPLANTTYVVYFRSLANSATYSYQVTSDANKLLTLTLDDGFPLATLTGYELWINAAGDSIEKQLDLLIGVTTSNCFTLSAIKVYDAYYGENENYASQTLEVAD